MSFAVDVTSAPVRADADIERAITALGREPGGSLIIVPDTFTDAHRDLIIGLAARHRLPAVYPYTPFAADGGLMTYGPDPAQMFGRTADYVDRILRGARAADLPVQQPAMPVVGFVRDTSLADATHLVIAFRQGLKEAGFIEGRNVVIEYRSAEDQAHRLPALVADLVRQQVALIVGNTPSALAAKAVTTTVPIVFVTGEDPVINGLVASLNRPGGNLTGVSFLPVASVTKRLELLRQFVPKAGVIAMLVHPKATASGERELRDVLAAVDASGQKLIVVEASSDLDIETAFATFAQRGAVALFIGSHAFFNSRRERVAALAIHYALPAAYSMREFATAGGLMSYGTSITDAYRLAGTYAGRILKGEKQTDLPVMQSTKFEFVINLRTAKALAIEVPPTLHAVADEVIE